MSQSYIMKIKKLRKKKLRDNSFIKEDVKI